MSSKIMPNNFSMFCKTYNKDYVRVCNLVNSFNLHNKDGLKLYICVSRNEFDLFKNLKSENVDIILDDDIPVQYFTEHIINGYTKGYLNQQIAKLGFWKLNKCNHYFCADSDLIFIRDFYESDFMYNNDTPFVDINFWQPYIADKNMSDEHYHIHHDRIKKIRDTYGFRYSSNEKYLLSTTGFPVISTKVMEALEKDFLAPKNWNYKDLLKIVPTEFHWYSQWLIEKSNNYKTAPTPICVFRNEKEYAAYQEFGWNINDISKYYIGIILNSNWSAQYHYGKPNKIILKLLNFLRKWI